MNVIERRRTVRDFDDRPVPDEVVNKAIGAGFHAPTYNHLRQWDVIRVHDRAIRLALTMTEEMVEEVTAEIKESFLGYDDLARNMYLDAIPKQKRMIAEAPEVLVVVYKPKTAVAESTRVYDLNCLASVWCFIENVLLSLAGDDVFGVTFIPKNTPKIKEVLGVPGHLEVAAIIPFGYERAGARRPAQKEVQLTERIHFDKW